MTRSILFLLFSIFSISLYCQTEFIIGERTKIKKRIIVPKFFEKSDSGDYIAIILNKKTPFLSHYDENLNLIKEVDLNTITDEEVKEISFKNDTINLITFNLDKQNKIVEYNRYSSHLNEFDFKKSSILKIGEDFKKTAPVFLSLWHNGADQYESFGVGEIYKSKNKRYFSVVFDIEIKDKQATKVFVFDDDFKLIINSNFEVGIKDKLFDLYDIKVNDDGSVFLLGLKYKNNKTKTLFNNQVNYDFEITKINNQGSVKLIVNTNGLYLKDISIHKVNDKFLLAGYSSNPEQNKQESLFLSEIDSESLTQKNIAIIPFTDDFIEKSKMISNKKKKKKKKSFSKDYKIRELHYINGAYFIVSEVYYTESTHSPAMDREIYSMIYGNIVLHKLNDFEDFGEYKIVNKLMKSGLTFNSKSSSILFKKNDKIHLIFEAGKNTEGVNYRGGENAGLFVLTFDSNLDKREEIFDLGSKFYPNPSLIIDNEYIMSLTREIKKKTKGLVKIIPK